MRGTLSHHGIAGQKWGKRNGPPYPLAPSAHSAAEEKANWRYSLNRNTNKNTAVQRIAGNSMEAGKLSIFRRKTGNTATNKASSKTKSPLGERITSPFKKMGLMSKNGIDSKDIHLLRLGTLRSMNDEGIRVKKGEWVRRIISTPTQDLSGRDSLFVAATEADKKNYAGFFAALTKYRNDVDKMYKMDLQAANDIISPSKKERVQTFIDLYKEDPVDMSTRLAEFNKRWYGGQYKETTEQLIKKYSNMSMHQLKNEGYYVFANSWFDPDAGTLKQYSEKLKSKGYNATIDDNDKRSFIQAQAPLIVFDVMKNFGDVKYSDLTMGEIRRNMIDWQYMKHEEDQMTYEQYLAHHGVLGMHWGVRRYQNKDGTLTEAGKKRRQQNSSDYERYKELKKRRKKTLSNKELEEIIKRQELEYKAEGKTKAQEAADEELARFGVKALTTAAIASAAVVGGLYLKNKYNITLESTVQKITQLGAKITGTAAKESAKQVGSSISEFVSSGQLSKTLESAAKVGSKAVTDAGSAIAKGASATIKNAGQTLTSNMPAVKRAAKKAADAGLTAIGKAEVGAAKGAVEAGKAALRKLGLPL